MSRATVENPSSCTNGRRNPAIKRMTGLGLACLLCCNLTGCSVFSVMGEALLIVIQGIIILFQALVPVALKIAPLVFLAEADGSGMIRLEYADGPEGKQIMADVVRFVEENSGNIVSARAVAFKSTDPEKTTKLVLKACKEGGYYTNAIVIPCDDQAALQELCDRLNRRFAKSGLNMKALPSAKYRDVLARTGQSKLHRK